MCILRFMTHELLSPSVGDLEEVLSHAVKLANSDEYPELRCHLLYWAGHLVDPNKKFFTKTNGKNVSLLVGDENFAESAFTIGIGETSIIFDNRLAVAGYMVYKSMPFGSLVDRKDIGRVIYEFIKERPTPDQLIDIRAETLKQKMVVQRDKTEVVIPDILLKSLRVRGFQK